jgi:hypothetical protein
VEGDVARLGCRNWTAVEEDVARLRCRNWTAVEGDVARLGCRNWTVVALNREGWRKLLKEAEAHPGL